MTEPNHLKIYRYTPSTYQDGDPDEPDFGLQYKTGLTRRLHPEVFMKRGEVTRVIYHASATPSPSGPVYSDPVLQEDISYVRDEAGNAVTQRKEISWYLEDDSLHSSKKVMEKVYNRTQSIAEGVRRRSNVYEDMKGNVMTFLAATEMPKGTPLATIQAMGSDFIDAHAGEIEAFIEAGKPTLYHAIMNVPSYGWLDNIINSDGLTIRGFLINGFDIWGLGQGGS